MEARCTSLRWSDTGAHRCTECSHACAHTYTCTHTHAHRTLTHIHVSTCTYLCTYTTYTITANNVISNSAPRSREGWSLRERTQIFKCHSSLPWESSQAIGEWEVTETTWVQKEKRCSGWIPGPSIHGINTRYRRRMWDQRCRRCSWQNPAAILRKKKNNNKTLHEFELEKSSLTHSGHLQEYCHT